MSAFVVLDDLTQVAVGFANGSVTVIRGDFIHDRGTKQRTVFESEDPITGLEVRQRATTVLYIANTSKISSLIISGKGQGQPVRTVDNRGCNVGCMTQDRETGDIVIAREDAIYYYGSNGRGPSYAFEGPKKSVNIYKEYVGVVCPPRVAQVSKSKTFRRLGGDEIDELFSNSSFTLLDTDLKYVAHTESLPAQVKQVFVEWNELFLLTVEGKVRHPTTRRWNASCTDSRAVVPVSGEDIAAETGDPLPAQSVHLRDQSCAEIRSRQNATEYHLQEIW